MTAIIQRLVEKHLRDMVKPLYVIGGYGKGSYVDILGKETIALVPGMIRMCDYTYTGTCPSHSWAKIRKSIEEEHGKCRRRLVFRSIPEGVDVHSRRTGVYHSAATYPLLWDESGIWGEFPSFREFYFGGDMEKSRGSYADSSVRRRLGVYEVIIPDTYDPKNPSVFTTGSIVKDSFEAMVLNPEYVLPRWIIPHIDVTVHPWIATKYILMMDGDARFTTINRSFPGYHPEADDTKNADIEKMIQDFPSNDSPPVHNGEESQRA